MTKLDDNNEFSIKIGQLLRKYRDEAKLTQSEVANRLGLSKTAGFTYVSQLETGKLKNPSLMLILRYLKVCGIPWTSFFQKLSAIDFKLEHAKIMKQVELPSNLTSKQRKKIDRDSALYLNKVLYPKTPFQKLDWERIRDKIDKKVKILLFNHQLDENGKQPYFGVMNELIQNYDTGKIPEILNGHRQARVLKYGIIDEIRKIVYQTVRQEEYRLKKQKALPSEKFKKMTGEFLRYRIKIELIEAAVQKKLGKLNVPIFSNQAYKNFTREYVSALKKYRTKPLLLTQRFAEMKRTYLVQGLQEEVLVQLKEIITGLIESVVPKK